ncbi:hypothetical protein L615_001200000390 [Nocardioides sp. J9]|nr:hypothetical protein L615_001200000390 [Nocardioides sp. J9]
MVVVGTGGGLEAHRPLGQRDPAHQPGRGERVEARIDGLRRDPAEDLPAARGDLPGDQVRALAARPVEHRHDRQALRRDAEAGVP